MLDLGDLNFNFDLSSLENSMLNTYQIEYQDGLITKDDLKSYQIQGIITAKDYQRIVGDSDEKLG